ncbi:hypothetical protein ES708_15809 [subsurface metagenome]
MADLYEVKYEKLDYRSLEGAEIDFLSEFYLKSYPRNGTFIIDEEHLDEVMEACKENGNSQVPPELVQFLRQKIKEGEYGDLVLLIE